MMRLMVGYELAVGCRDGAGRAQDNWSGDPTRRAPTG
jgi:hypothetical protein